MYSKHIFSAQKKRQLYIKRTREQMIIHFVQRKLFWKTNISCVYQGVGNVWFSEKFPYVRNGWSLSVITSVKILQQTFSTSRKWDGKPLKACKMTKQSSQPVSFALSDNKNFIWMIKTKPKNNDLNHNSKQLDQFTLRQACRSRNVVQSSFHAISLFLKSSEKNTLYLQKQSSKDAL